MNIKKGVFFVFAAIILLVPVYVAVSSHNVLNKGKLYKFKPVAYDPFDPLRGKYLRVNYETDNIPTKFDFKEGETVYVSIGIDENGFAFFEEAFKSPPENKAYLKTKVDWAVMNSWSRKQIEIMIEQEGIENSDTRSKINIDVPDNMNKYFIINEDDALYAEKVLMKEQENSYVGVRVWDGEARLEDIYVHDQPVLEYLDAN